MTTYDAIVVGARCAGAPTAMLLARQGHRVLLVDRATFPSDTVSTHMIHAPGVAALRRWGLLDAVIGTGCPPIDTYSLDVGPIVLRGTPHPFDGAGVGYAPRRTLLDAILVAAAAEAGVEIREAFTLEDLVFDDGTVVGIRGHARGGASVVERARVVVGADGRNSKVAKAVKPEHYRDKPMLQFGYYAYWSDLPIDSFAFYDRGGRGFGAIPTNGGLTLVVAGWPYAEAAAYKSDPEANFLATVDRAPAFGERLRAATRESRFVGASCPNFFRRPYGPGWALVGDAGYTKDPITAQGISDAFNDAELCAAAIGASLRGERPFDDAMADYQRARDERVLPLYEFTTELAKLEPPSEEQQQLFAALQGNQRGIDAFVSIIAGTLSPATFFEPDYLGGLLGGPVPA